MVPPVWNLPARALRSVIVAIAAGAVVLHIANICLIVWLGITGAADLLPIDMDRLTGGLLSVLAWGIGFAVLGLAIILRAEHREATVVAALFLSLYSLWGAVLFSPVFEGAVWERPVLAAFDVLCHTIGIRFTQLFPRRLSREDLAARFPKLPARALGALLDPRVYWPAALAFELAVRVPFAGDVGSPLLASHLLVWLGLATAYMYTSFRQGSLEDRKRIFWILEGIIVFLVAELIVVALWAILWLEVLEFDLYFWAIMIRGVSAWLTLGCFAMAIFHSGAFDSGLVLRRTTAVAIAGVMVLAVFVALETTIEELLEEMLGLESRFGGIVAGVTAALAFRPVSVRIDRWMQRGGREFEP